MIFHYIFRFNKPFKRIPLSIPLNSTAHLSGCLERSLNCYWETKQLENVSHLTPYMSTEIFHWGGGKPKILEGGWGQGEKKFSRGGNRAGRKIFWSHFSKILWRGICMGNYKENSGGGCGRGNKKYRREIWILISEIGDVGREVGGDVGRELAKLFLERGEKARERSNFQEGE